MQWEECMISQSVEMMYGASDQPAVVVNGGLYIVWRNDSALSRFGFFSKPDGLLTMLSHNDAAKALRSLEQGLSFSCYAGSSALPFTKIFLSPLCQGKERTGYFLSLFDVTAFSGAAGLNTVESSIATYSGHSRGPLNRIFLALNRLSQKRSILADKEIMPIVKTISQNGYRLLRHSINMTEYMRFMCGVDTAEKETVNLSEQIYQLCSAAFHLMQESGILFNFDLPSDPLFCLCSWKQIELAVLNILSNACRFPRIDPTVSIRMEAKNRSAVLTIRDNGTGISEENMTLIYRPFFSTDDVVAETAGGGLGLTVAKLCVESCGGNVKVTSTMEVGTTVMITLPLSQKPEIPVLKSPDSRDLMHDRFSSLYVILSDVCQSPWP